jgi:hypothetical protein
MTSGRRRRRSPEALWYLEPEPALRRVRFCRREPIHSNRIVL